MAKSWKICVVDIEKGPTQNGVLLVFWSTYSVKINKMDPKPNFLSFQILVIPRSWFGIILDSRINSACNHTRLPFVNYGAQTICPIGGLHRFFRKIYYY